MNIDHYISLIYKQLKGEADNAEQQELAKWEEQSQSNRTEAQAIRNAWRASKNEHLPFELDLDADFNAIQNKVKATSSDTKVVAMKPRRRWLQLAAGVAILAVAVFALRNFMSETAPEWQTLASADATLMQKLPDGTIIYLNEGSTLSFPKQFDADKRQVKLSGEGFFEVAKDASKPFSVLTDDVMVTVLGTQFNVRTGQDVEVAVKEGKVRVASNDGTQKVILVANETASYDTANAKLSKVKDRNLNSIAWQRKSLRFSNSRLDQAIADINKYFKTSVNLENQAMLECPINGRFKITTGVEAMLKDIAQTYGMKVEQSTTKNTYILKGGNCKD